MGPIRLKKKKRKRKRERKDEGINPTYYFSCDKDQTLMISQGNWVITPDKQKLRIEHVSESGTKQLLLYKPFSRYV